MLNWFRPELRVLFVCTANVCRSPLAVAVLLSHVARAGALRRRLRDRGVGERVRVRPFRGWCEERVRGYRLGGPPGVRGVAHCAALARSCSLRPHVARSAVWYGR